MVFVFDPCLCFLLGEYYWHTVMNFPNKGVGFGGDNGKRFHGPTAPIFPDVEHTCHEEGGFFFQRKVKWRFGFVQFVPFVKSIGWH